MNNMKDHVLSKHTDIEGHQKQFKCDQCDSKYYTKNKLETHMIVHSNFKAFQCDCGSSFKKKSDLRTHQKRHCVNQSEKEEKTHKCDQCDYTVHNKYALKKHISAVHLKMKPFKCETCGKACSSSEGLKSHVKRMHLDQREYGCDLCIKRFNVPSELKNYKAMCHTNYEDMTKYSCDVCDFVTVYKQSLGNHKLLIHNNKQK